MSPRTKFLVFGQSKDLEHILNTCVTLQQNKFKPFKVHKQFNHFTFTVFKYLPHPPVPITNIMTVSFWPLDQIWKKARTREHYLRKNIWHICSLWINKSTYFWEFYLWKFKLLTKCVRGRIETFSMSALDPCILYIKMPTNCIQVFPWKNTADWHFYL